MGKIIKIHWKTLKMTQTNGDLDYVCDLEISILYKFHLFPNQPIDEA